MDDEKPRTTVDIHQDEKSVQNFERVADLELSPRGDYSKKEGSSSCPDLNSEKNQLEKSHHLEAGENITNNISTVKLGVEGLSNWEEGQEREISIIEPVSSDITTNHMDNIEENYYWSSVGLLRNKKTDPLYIGPVKVKRDSGSTNSVYEEEVLNLISPTDDSNCEEEHSESENETTVFNYFGSLDEISIGGEYTRIETPENEEPVEKLEIKENKKGFFARLFGRLFHCICYTKEKR